ncbi:MAG TPA: glycosyltransferase family 4 protein [Flavobacteriales bacterium]|nr:glycosyltransferase family 4 protein [Flavobacteriales bacterium]HPF66687.1 glycosyltransferase family 4 protein [Flavobacteriales bacterium]HPJ51300.1 glycosyltransferase family 4 protein [Flavobacteriales bacterium]HPQ57304.1 glycosyltransferase family 4 protein [Flavobacteriales bacterium]
MRVLQLCHKPPCPPVDGGSKAMHNLTTGLLKAGHEVVVRCISTPKHPMRTGEIPEAYRRSTDVRAVFVDTSLNIVDAFTDLITADNYNLSRFFSPDMDIELIRTLSGSRFDIILLESLFMTPYIATVRRYTQAPIVLRSHNLEHVVQERIAQGERNPLKRPYRRFLAKQLRDHELAVLERIDGVAAISSSDLAHFRAQHAELPMCTIPFGVDIEAYPLQPWPDGAPTCFHLGSMDWLPNEDGIRWLLDEVWPRAIAERPGLRLELAGNQMPQDLLEAEIPGVRIRGRVPDARQFMEEGQIMVVPLLSAGGMRVKIVEGMALGKAVLSTTIGAEGIEAEDGRQMILADGPEAFAKALVRTHDDPAGTRAIGEAARQLIAERYDDRRIVADLIAFFEQLMGK